MAILEVSFQSSFPSKSSELPIYVLRNYIEQLHVLNERSITKHAKCLKFALKTLNVATIRFGKYVLL